MNIKAFASIETNSKNCKNNSLFICLKGSSYDGHDYIDEAISNGASFIVCEEYHSTITTPYKIVPNTHVYLAFCAMEFYDCSPDDFKIIGVTGTDGKTTVSMMIYQLLSQHEKVCYIGTLGIIYDGICEKNKNTTPDALLIAKTFKILKAKNITTIVIEASSEGLFAHRLDALTFDIAIFTNLSHEHLNTHHNMNDYFKQKSKLFSLLKPHGYIIANNEDYYGQKVLKKYPNTISFGLKAGDIYVKDYKLNLENTAIDFIYKNRNFQTIIPFFGIYNIYNYLAAIATIPACNLSQYDLTKLVPVKGRFEMLKTDDFSVIIDFAHTPNALYNLLSNVKKIINGRLILVMGAAGLKDKTKRVKMGKVADDYADLILLTSEDPKTEPLHEIFSDLAKGIRKKDFYYFYDRKEAIKKALDLSFKNDMIIITGKGLEDFEIIYNYKIKYCDYDYVRQQLLLRKFLINT